jgi:hypothetical protein
LGDKEKNAISDAETNPEQKSNNKAKTKATIAPVVGVLNVIQSKSSAN